MQCVMLHLLSSWQRKLSAQITFLRGVASGDAESFLQLLRQALLSLGSCFS